MKAFLLYPDRDFDIQQPLPWNADALTQDLELTTLFNAMARGDEFLYDVAQKGMLAGVEGDLATIHYRQAILKDCLNNPAIIRQIYALTVDAIERERKAYLGFFSKYVGAALSRAIDVLQMFVGMLKELRLIAEQHADQFVSEGFKTLFGMLKRELSDDYFADVWEHLRFLKFRYGVLISAQLGNGNTGINYILRKPHKPVSWRERIFGRGEPAYGFQIADRDENGARALSELRDKGINSVANALAQSTDQILSFFTLQRTELAFYVGCLNLHEQLAQLGEPIAFPVPVAASERRHAFRDLCDVSLALNLKQIIVGNDLEADGKDLGIITGANQGGKSTFLRSIGLAQLMMQCGMFVPAESFCANVCEGLFTHFRREEDVSMQSGKLDEEMSRMSAIVDGLTPNSLLLFNESFAATNEREGSEIARQIVSALLDKHIKVFFVTHLYTFAHGFYAQRSKNAVFLRAERRADGTRTFRLPEGEPLQTSFGVDVYNEIFATES